MTKNSLHTGGVTGSIPVAPTISAPDNQSQCAPSCSTEQERAPSSGGNPGEPVPASSALPLAERYGREPEKDGVRAAVKYPEYEPGARFRCSEGCGTFRRDQCGSYRGGLHCPRCRYVGTLRYQSPAPTPETGHER